MGFHQNAITSKSPIVILRSAPVVIRFLAIFLLMATISLGCRPEPKTQKGTDLPADEPSPAEIDTDEKGFESLKLDSFIPFHGGDDTWTQEGSLIICSGVPKGYLYPKETFRNFTLRADYQFVLTEDQSMHPEKANTGFMLCIQEPDKVWPISLEVQGRFDTMGSINGNGGTPAPKIEDLPDVRDRVRLPTAHWNTVEITCVEGAITSRLNGEVVCRSEPTELKEGRLGLQAEGYVVRFRDVRVRRDPAGPRQVTQ
jgi:hypothetical protein